MATNLITIEGVRGSGKTTLIKDLGLQLSSMGYDIPKVEKGRTPEESQLRDISMKIARSMINPDSIFIHDRLNLSEIVMSSYFHRRPLIDLYQETCKMERWLNRINAITIVLMADLEVINQRVAARNDGRGHDIIPEIGQLLFAHWSMRTNSYHIWMRNETLEDKQSIIDFVVETVKDKSCGIQEAYSRASSISLRAHKPWLSGRFRDFVRSNLVVPGENENG